VFNRRRRPNFVDGSLVLVLRQALRPSARPGQELGSLALAAFGFGSMIEVLSTWLGIDHGPPASAAGRTRAYVCK